MKLLLSTLLCLFLTTTVLAQDKYFTKSGEIKFEASVANFEPVAAQNNTVSAVLKDDGSFAALVLIRGFKFKKALMQEHFNEDRFMGSETYPKSNFSGNIVDFDISQLSDSEKEFNITGTIKIHGVSKEIETTGLLKLVDNTIYLSSEFTVEVADFDIAVNSKVADKIAKTVNVTIDFTLVKK